MSHVLLDASGLVDTILGNCHPASCIRVDLTHVPRRKAVSLLRRRIFARSDGKCEHVLNGERCGRTITWDSFEMNERVHRGNPQERGLMSMENSEAACHMCHLDEHKERNPQWSRRNRMLIAMSVNEV